MPIRDEDRAEAARLKPLTRFDRAEPGTVHVVTRTRSVESNWRTTFRKIVTRAGLTIWEKPF
jgi:hypothetical protein